MVPALLLVPVLAAGSARSIAAPPQDPVQRIRVLAERGQRNRDGLSPDDLVDLRAACGEARVLLTGAPEREPEIDLALLELAAIEWGEFGNHTRGGRQALESMAQLGTEELERRFASDGEGFAAWLAAAVLDADRERPEVRIAAAALLRGRYLEPTRIPLLHMARDEDVDVRNAALEAIAGWPDAAIHFFFLDQLENGTAGTLVVARHLEAAGNSLGPGALDRLRQVCGRFYVSDDWRNAARAGHLIPYLDTRRAVPILIEALAVWERRREAGDGSKRILYEITDELQRVSGRSLGPVPERWMSWWQAVLEGRVELPEELAEEGTYISRPGFFGLRPVSGRVLFIVDRSGSMDSSFGTAGRSRYEEAVDQFVRFLRQSGADTRFGVVLFSDRAVRWRSGLVEATQSNIDSAERWLRKNDPDGGTQLREGVRKGLKLDGRDRIDLDDVEADTVIVLCDGATAEGPSWVGPWLAANNEEAQIVFHCAEIGSGGDGTLQELAEGSGGDFIQLPD